MSLSNNPLARLEAALFSFLAGQKSVAVGLSGGVDSSLLAYLLGRWQQQHPDASARAIHIHHGLSANADYWLQHCAHQAAEFGLSFIAQRVELTLGPRISVEAAARQARYQFFASNLAEGELLLTGHHQDDQAETLLLALKRGSGPAGLAAMAVSQPLGKGRLVRPWLAISRADIEQAAAQLGLAHINDESNSDDRFDRNFLRNQVIPTLRQRWPAISANIARTAELCREQQQLCDELAQSDLVACQRPDGSLSVGDSAQLSLMRRNNLLRFYIRQRGGLMPSQTQLQQAQQLWHARADSQPQLDWGHWSLRRYLDGIHLLPKPLPPLPKDQPFTGEVLQNGQHWLLQPCYDGDRVRPPKETEQVTIRYGLSGSTKLQPQGRDRRRELKKLWQEHQVPTWQRPYVAMLCYNDQVVAALGYWLESEFIETDGEGVTPVQSSNA